MPGYSLMGILYLVGFVSAQQYGPVPPRPQQFAGATLIQPARQNFRQRPVTGSRPAPEQIPSLDQTKVAQLRRVQPLRKIKSQLAQPQIADLQRANLIEEAPAPFTNKIVAPTPLPQFQTQSSKLTPRPVEEEVNEDEEVPTTIMTTPSTNTYTVPLRSNYQPAPAPAPVPAPLPQNQVPSGFQRAQFIQPNVFRPALPQQNQPVQFAAPVLQGRQLIRQQVRPVQGVQAPVIRQPAPQGLPSQIPASPPSAIEEDQYFRSGQNRPFKKQEAVRQQAIERESIRQQPVRQQPARALVDYALTSQREPHAKASQRERKPVAQTIRKYHEEHEDGSITWGYENDDGSFKEETIGVDCVTRGKYGYFDPDGVKREYTYQTGIPCDKAQESEEAASNQGFIDYTNNKYVLPNGDEIDLEAMVKNRARKPVSKYANRT